MGNAYTAFPALKIKGQTAGSSEVRKHLYIEHPPFQALMLHMELSHFLPWATNGTFCVFVHVGNSSKLYFPLFHCCLPFFQQTFSNVRINVWSSVEQRLSSPRLAVYRECFPSSWLWEFLFHSAPHSENTSGWSLEKAKVGKLFPV